MHYLTKSEYAELTKKHEGGHWTPETIETRWDYHNRVIELIKSLQINNAHHILEMGTMGIPCVIGSKTIDYAERWDFKGKNPTYLHDAREFPWPIKNKEYDLFIALRVFQHLIPVQKECVKEAMRISKKVILVVPETYKNKVLPNSKGITYTDFVDFLDGLHPNLYVPTAQGYLYYWDTENPSGLNIEKVMNQAFVIKYVLKELDNKQSSRNLTSKIKRLVKKALNGK
jgi:hypothetical protein